MNKSVFTENMNNKQVEAITYGDGAMLILAGAGSGKTRVLTHRIAFLIKKKSVHPSEILALTFTNKAANEMKERVENLIGPAANTMWIGTFHSMCLRILRTHCDKIGLGSNFVIYDTSDQKELLGDCISELNLDDKIYSYQYISKIISNSKDKSMDPETFRALNLGNHKLEKVADIYDLYSRKLLKNNAVDFDDILSFTVKILEKNKSVKDFYSDKFKYVLVDEYQDTNNIQYRLVKILSKKHGNLCVVGDDDQSIYGWRGANFENILNFESQFKQVKTVFLEQNYRSAKKILEAANNVISKNILRKNKKLWTESDNEGTLCTFTARNEYAEAQFIVEKIKDLIKKDKMEYKDFAILYRLNSLSRVLEDTLLSAGVPYKLFGGLKFYERKEIKDIIAYLRVIINPDDNLSLKRIVNFPRRGIGNISLADIERQAAMRDETILETMAVSGSIPELSKNASKYEKFVEMIFVLRADSAEMPVSKFVEKVIDSTGIMDAYVNSGKIENKARIDNIKEFVSAAVEFEKQSEDKSFESFMNNLALVTDLDSLDSEEGAVTLMTLHSSKGLEFPVVFIAGVENSTFPMSRLDGSVEELDEERRLCYVGITRAKNHLYLTCTKTRTVYGKTVVTGPSEYLSDIPAELIEDLSNEHLGADYDKRYQGSEAHWDKTPKNPGSPWHASASPRTHIPKDKTMFEGTGRIVNSVEQLNNMKKVSDDAFETGNKVEHRKFGIGVIEKVFKDSGDELLEIQFDKAGKKRLMAAYANLKKI